MAASLAAVACLHAWVAVVRWVVFTPHPTEAVVVMAWTGTIALLVLVSQRFLRSSALPRALTAATAIFVAAKLLILVHPLANEGDIGFHMNRMKLVASGTYYFTSLSPGGAFPYPTALYVLLRPVTAFMRNWQVALQLAPLVTDAAAGWLLSYAVWRKWASSKAALVTLALYHLTPAAFQVHAVLYLTNAFGHAVSVMAVAATALAVPRSIGGATVAGTLALVAFLSHVSSFVLLAGTLALGSLLWSWRGDETARPAARRLAFTSGAALVLAVALYYGHFGTTYYELASRPSPVPAAGQPWPPVQRAEAHQTAFAPGWEPFVNRVSAVPSYAIKYWGGGLMLLAAIGFSRLVKQRATDPLALLTGASLMTGAAFFVLGQITSIDVRYYLGLGPALAAAGGFAWRWFDAESRPMQIAIAISTTAALAEGARYLTDWFGPILPR